MGFISSMELLTRDLFIRKVSSRHQFLRQCTYHTIYSISYSLYDIEKIVFKVFSNKVKLGKHYKKLSDGKDIVLWYYEKDEKWRIASGERFKEKLTLYLFI